MGMTAADRALELYSQQKTLLAALGLIAPRVRIDRAQVSAASTYTTPLWVAGQYERVDVEFFGVLSNSYMQLQVNGDTGLNYSDFGANNGNGAVAVDNAAKGTNGFARTMVAVVGGTSGVMLVSFYPLTTGRERGGQAQSTTISPAGTAAQAFTRTTGFCWHNTAADVTNMTIFPTAGQSMTGVIGVYGYPTQ